MAYYRFSFLFATSLCLLFCKPSLESFLPQTIAEDVTLQQKQKGSKAIDSLSHVPPVAKALAIASPQETVLAIYQYQGIQIYLALMTFANSDLAFGLQAQLANMPRILKNMQGGEYRYKHPFVVSRKKDMVMLTFSQPYNYFAWFEKLHNKILGDITSTKGKKPLSYHRKILPEQNKYRNSDLYFKEKRRGGLFIEDAYSARYQIKNHTAEIYVSKFTSAAFANSAFASYQKFLATKGIKVTPLPHLAGGPGGGVYYKTASGYQVIYPYRWIILLLFDFSDINQAELQIRNMFMNMNRIRDQVVR